MMRNGMRVGMFRGAVSASCFWVACVMLLASNTALAAPSVSIDQGSEMTIGPMPPFEVCLTATVNNASSVRWSKDFFTSLGVAYDPANFPAFEILFQRPFDPVADLTPTGPGSVRIVTPSANDTCVIFDNATRALDPGVGFVPVVEPARRTNRNYALNNDTGAYLISVTVADSAGDTATDTILVHVLSDEDPSEFGTHDDRVPPRDANGLEAYDPHSHFDFLERGGVTDDNAAQAYYNTIDPFREKDTLDKFLRENGFYDPVNTVVTAAYANQADLGAGRFIAMVEDKRGGVYKDNIAYMTINHFSVEEAIATDEAFLVFINKRKTGDNSDHVDLVDPLSIVNMEYSPGPDGDASFAKFYVYKDSGDGNGDPDGVREIQLTTDADGRGQKGVPGMCVACHAGNSPKYALGPNDAYPADVLTGGLFLPFDSLPMEFSSRPGYERADIEAKLKLMNEGVLRTDPNKATREFIKGVYGGSNLPNLMQDHAYVPQDWKDAGYEDLYLQVLAPSCRNCHTTSETSLMTFAGFKSEAADIREEVYNKQSMPNALNTYELFWTSTNPHQPRVLDEALRALGSNSDNGADEDEDD